MRQNTRKIIVGIMEMLVFLETQWKCWWNYAFPLKPMGNAGKNADDNINDNSSASSQRKSNRESDPLNGEDPNITFLPENFQRENVWDNVCKVPRAPGSILDPSPGQQNNNTHKE